MAQAAACPLCHHSELELWQPKQDRRDYWFCSQCFLIHARPRYLLDKSEEKQRYDQHENSLEDQGYVRFLNQIIEPALRYLQPGMKGLDYGSGPGPIIAPLLARHKIDCQNYDPIYQKELPQGPFDFVFSTETFEHFHHPARELQHLKSISKPGAFLFIMTELWKDKAQFWDWYYKTDDTHVSFYHWKTIEWIPIHLTCAFWKATNTGSFC